MGDITHKRQQANLDLSDAENDENLLKFMENLDYDKYIKNLEVREALYLLKNKVEKDGEKDDGKGEIDQENSAANQLNEKEDLNQEKIGDDLHSTNLPPIENKNLILHDKEWNEKKEDAEILKKRMADKILKLDKVNFELLLSFKKKTN